MDTRFQTTTRTDPQTTQALTPQSLQGNLAATLDAHDAPPTAEQASTELDQVSVLTARPAIDEGEAPEIPAREAGGAQATSNVPQTGPLQAGKGGEGGVPRITNAEFIAAVLPILPECAFAAVCTKPGDPTSGGWVAHRANIFVAELTADDNNYLGCSSFYPCNDGSFKAQKGQFAACHFLMLDDVGTKVPLDLLAVLPLTWLIETSPGNHQAGIAFAEPLTDGDVAVRLLDALIAKGLCDKGSTGPLSRWARLPVAINGKQKYVDEAGEAFRCRLVQWRPQTRYSPEQVVERLQLELAPAGRPKKTAKPTSAEARNANIGESVFTPKAEENPVVTALKSRGLYKRALGSGKHDITCPWVSEHTDGIDNGAAYFEPDEQYPVGGFRCQHSHGDQRKLKDLLSFIGVSRSAASHKPVIRVVPGTLAKVVEAAEMVLADLGRHFVAGGLIVAVRIDPVTGDPSILPTNKDALTRDLSEAAHWETFDGSAKDWVPADPPIRHVTTLYNAQNFRHLPSLAGIARQPYFREADGVLVTEPGYDAVSRRFGAFDPREYANLPEPTMTAAKEALAELEGLLSEFRFVAPTDRAAALSAMCTAVVRPSLPYAPGFHIHAPVSGSGKSYLGELTCLFAGPTTNTKVSYPTTSEEATKAMLALLLVSPAAIEFDDMTTDWIPHGVINRMFTSEGITDRVLGVSKTATVGTRVLVLGSGNNVGPVRDLRRRVVTIHLDPRVAVPAMIKYQGSPVDRVRQNRGHYVGLVLTIIQAWRQAGSPRAKLDSIATYNGAWTDLCRQPLVWLGHPDPATALIEQVSHDPDTDALLGLMTAWHAAFGSTPTTVRDALAASMDEVDLRDALHDCPVDERGTINRNKLGWFLKKNVNRIVRGFEFQRIEGGGRTAWRVATVKPPASPPLPPSVVASVTTDVTPGELVSTDVEPDDSF